ncbi:HD domain-containing phosphohydrolase [Clostridium sp.]|uniref:HD domain-containing phosphohydrolase n=1 Tax=Clostridium sp. TaxID=1506 RepID=UPI003F334C34
MKRGFCTLGKAMRVLQKSFDNANNLNGHGEKVGYIVWKILKETNKHSIEEVVKLTMIAFFHDICNLRVKNNIYKNSRCYTERHSICSYLFIKYMMPYNKLVEDMASKCVCNEKYKYIKEDFLICFVDKIEKVISEDIDLTYENIRKETSPMFKDEVESLIEFDKKENIFREISNGNYKKEFYSYLDSFELSRSQLIELVRVVVFVIDSRSQDTIDHSVYVSAISMIVYGIIEPNGENKRLIGLSGFLHDVGKITTPIDILENPGSLNPEEMNIMRNHVVKSKEILNELGLTEISDIIILHHERLDGSGYPYGVLGEHINLEARIIMAVDIFSALIGKRSYKKEFTKDVVISILTNLVQRQKLDKKVVNVLTSNYDEIVSKAKKVTKDYFDFYRTLENKYIKLYNSEAFISKIYKRNLCVEINKINKINK